MKRNYVGKIGLVFSPDDSLVRLEIDEVGGTTLTMDQIDSLAAILRGWVNAYQQVERAEDTARRRSQGAKDGWEIRRGKQSNLGE